MAKPRDFKAEYKAFHGKPKEIKRRAERNKSRTIMSKTRGKAAIRGKDIDHKDRNTSNMAPKNLRVQSKKVNRSRK